MKAVFFDKDGTLIKNIPYNVNPDLIELTTGAAEAVQKLRAAGFRLFIVSNQSGVARGFFLAEELAAVWQKLNELCGVEFDGFYYCPHFENGKIAEYSVVCNCRKPAAGMILRAAREHQIDLKNSWLIGDTLSDIEAGQRAGCHTILFSHPNEVSDDQTPLTQIAESLTEAAKLILSQRF